MTVCRGTLQQEVWRSQTVISSCRRQVSYASCSQVGVPLPILCHLVGAKSPCLHPAEHLVLLLGPGTIMAALRSIRSLCTIGQVVPCTRTPAKVASRLGIQPNPLCVVCISALGLYLPKGRAPFSNLHKNTLGQGLGTPIPTSHRRESGKMGATATKGQRHLHTVHQVPDWPFFRGPDFCPG